MPEKIKIDANSWHYKLYSDGRSRVDVLEPKNLCDYFWGILKTLGFFAMIGSLVLVLILLMLAGILLIGMIASTLSMYFGPLIAIAVTTFIVGICLCFYFRECISGSKTVRELSKKTSGFLRLILTYAKAKKEKYCPLVEIEHTKKDKQA